MRPDLPEAALHRVAAEILAAQPGASGAKACEAIHEEVAKRLRIDPTVKKAMEEAFARRAEEFRGVPRSNDSVVLESVRRQVHGVTGGQMREFAQRLRDAAPRPLTEEMILEWADAYYSRNNEWPVIDSGPVRDEPGETWAIVDAALRAGTRSLPGNSSLPRLLSEHRGVSYHLDLPKLAEANILEWADAHHERTGDWPTRESGPIEEAPGESWAKINSALKAGIRGLPGRSSLAQVLAEHRGVRNRSALPPLTIEQILGWADDHKRLTGEWPTAESGPVQASLEETWAGINGALAQGLRNLPGGSSLARLLSQDRGIRNLKNLPPLTIERILEWADAHHERTGKWPNNGSGAVDGVPDETWGAVHSALQQGGRSLSGGSSLAKLLAEKRGVRNNQDLPSLTVDNILAWADAHQGRTGKWPTQKSGPIVRRTGGDLAERTNGTLGRSSRASTRFYFGPIAYRLP